MTASSVTPLRFLITGATGMLGTDLTALLRIAGGRLTALGRTELDITERDAVFEIVERERPDVLINCAAFTKVDDCESQPDLANHVNGTAVGHLAEAANRCEALLVQISTDFVFDGSSTRPYQPDDAVNPLSAYGVSKLLGEREAARAEKHLILRTSWVFGKNGPNFVEAIWRQIAAGKRELRVVNDQRGRPTATPHVAEAIAVLVASADARGIVHYADAPECTWFELAGEIARRVDPEVVVHPVTSDAFPRPAKRPAYSVLSTARYEAITGRAPRSWKEGLAEYLAS